MLGRRGVLQAAKPNPSPNPNPNANANANPNPDPNPNPNPNQVSHGPCTIDLSRGSSEEYLLSLARFLDGLLGMAGLSF